MMISKPRLTAALARFEESFSESVGLLVCGLKDTLVLRSSKLLLNLPLVSRGVQETWDLLSMKYLAIISNIVFRGS